MNKIKKDNVDKINELNNITQNKKEDTIKIIYKINNQEKRIKIFGTEFVNLNKNVCKIIFQNKIYNLKEYFDCSKCKNESFLKIKLSGISYIKDIEQMFHNSTSLYKLPDISKINTEKFKSLYSIFYNCSSLSSISDISNWNTNNIENMSHLFCGCSSLKSLPDISKWNTNKVTKIFCMFGDCSSLLSLPDIDNWNISNVKNIRTIL